MKMVVAIVADQDAGKVIEALVNAGYPGPTRINTVGGFLRRGNFTSTDDLRAKVLAFIAYFNQTMATPFKWTYSGRPLAA